MPERFIPRDYQHKGSFYLALRRGALLGDQVGLGKTATGIMGCREVNAQRVLVICPLHHKRFWVSEIAKVEQGLFGSPIVVTEQTMPYCPRVLVGRSLQKTARYYDLAHPEQFQHLGKDEYGNPLRDARGKIIPCDITAWYLQQVYDVILIDECHRFKNRNAQRSYWLRRLHTTYKWGLSGTLVAERPDDLWALLNWINRGEFSSYWGFVETYCYVDNSRSFRKVTGLRYSLDPTTGRSSIDITLAALKRRLENYILMRTREDVGLELPEYTVVPVPLEMNADQAAAYQQIKGKVIIDLVEELGDPDLWDLDLCPENKLFITNAGARFMYLQEVTSEPSIFFAGTSNAKLEWLQDYIEDVGEPAVIAARFVKTVDAIEGTLKKLGVKVARFKSGKPAPKIDPDSYILGTFETLSESHNFQHLNIAIAVDAPKSRLDWEQFQGRIRRIGQQRPQVYYQLMLDGTINKQCWKLIDKKQSTVDVVTQWLRDVQKEYNQNA